MAAVPLKELLDCVICQDICPGPDESDADPAQLPVRLREGEGWAGVAAPPDDPPPLPPQPAAQRMATRAAPCSQNVKIRAGVGGVVDTARLEHQLEPEDAAPECAPSGEGILLPVLDLFPDRVELNLDPPVQSPVHAEGKGLLSA